MQMWREDGEAGINCTGLGAASWQEPAGLQEASSARLGRKKSSESCLVLTWGFPCSGRCRISVSAPRWGKRWPKGSSWGVGAGMVMENRGSSCLVLPQSEEEDGAKGESRSWGGRRGGLRGIGAGWRSREPQFPSATGGRMQGARGGSR